MSAANESFSGRLRRACNSRGMAPMDLECELGVTTAMLAAWDAGITPPPRVVSLVEAWIARPQPEQGRFAKAPDVAQAASFFGMLHKANLRSHRALFRLNEDNDEQLLSARETYRLCVDTKIPEPADARLLHAMHARYQRVAANLRTMLSDIERLDTRTTEAIALARHEASDRAGAVA